MPAQSSRPWRVADLMDQHKYNVSTLAETTGLENRVVEAIACQRYTPSLQQRLSVSAVFGLQCELIMWGHATAVDREIHQPI